MNTPEAEARIILRCKQQDTEAFKPLVEAYQQMVYRVAFRLLCHEEEARDMVQEVFIKTWKNMDSFKTNMKFSTWLYKITVNLCYDRMKSAGYKKAQKENTAENLMLFSALDDDDIEKRLTNQRLLYLIKKIAGGLPPKQHLVFTLSDLEEKNVDEIRTLTGLSAKKIKSNLYLARKYIRQRISNYV